MMQPDQRQGRAYAPALRVRIDADHVHLAEIIAVDLRPVEAEQLTGLLVERHEQTTGIEPGLGPSLGDIGIRPAALLWVPGKGGVVDAQEIGVVIGAAVGVDADSGWNPGRR